MRFLTVLIWVVFLCWSCTVSKHTRELQNEGGLYNPGSSYLHPEYQIYHQSDSASQLILKINTEELLFNQANPSNTMQALVKIQYQLVDITENLMNKSITDSATIIKRIDKVAGKNILLSSYTLKTQYGKNYSLKVSFIDLIRNVKQQSYVPVNKVTKYSGQNFKVVSRLSDQVMFRNFVVPQELVRISYCKPGVKQLYVKYSKNTTPLPPPPFAVQTEPAYNFVADSLWILPYNPQQNFLFQYQGAYLIQTDTTQSEGLFLTNPGKNFPKVTEAPYMIPPLEYFTTTDEFNGLRNSDTSKLSVDYFWLRTAGTLDMARELIRIFYNRMFYTNLFFTSYKEGWKTDRGMIFLIFGPPSFVNKDAVSETWVYYVKQDGANLTIKFNKKYSPYSENHYVMLRNDSYMRFWRTAVDTWRKGKAYSLED